MGSQEREAIDRTSCFYLVYWHSNEAEKLIVVIRPESMSDEIFKCRKRQQQQTGGSGISGTNPQLSGTGCA
jgi:hypothetical protein